MTVAINLFNMFQLFNLKFDYFIFQYFCDFTFHTFYTKSLSLDRLVNTCFILQRSEIDNRLSLRKRNTRFMRDIETTDSTPHMQQDV